MLKISKKFGALLLSSVFIFSLTACGSASGVKDAGEGADTEVSQNEASGDTAVLDSSADTKSSEVRQEQAQPEARQEQAGQEQVKPEQSQPEYISEEKAAAQSSEDGNSLVVYFSRTGEQYTVGVIEKGNTAIVAEMIADETGADLYEIMPADDHYPMTYEELTDVAKQEQNENARPAYQDNVPDLSQYGTVFIGAPVWWGDWPMIMYTFFENEDLSGKTLIPFSTHEGSGLSGFDRKLSEACPNAEIAEGLAIRGGDAQNDQGNVRAAVKEWVLSLGY